MPVEKLESVDGRDLIAVKFERQTPDAAAPIIEVVFEVVEPDGVFGSTVYVLDALSATRTDTREIVVLSPEERDLARTEAAQQVESLMKRD